MNQQRSMRETEAFRNEQGIERRERERERRDERECNFIIRIMNGTATVFPNISETL
jgi:hypothetical protein